MKILKAIVLSLFLASSFTAHADGEVEKEVSAKSAITQIKKIFPSKKYNGSSPKGAYGAVKCQVQFDGDSKSMIVSILLENRKTPAEFVIEEGQTLFKKVRKSSSFVQTTYTLTSEAQAPLLFINTYPYSPDESYISITTGLRKGEPVSVLCSL